MPPSAVSRSWPFEPVKPARYRTLGRRVTRKASAPISGSRAVRRSRREAWSTEGDDTGRSIPRAARDRGQASEWGRERGGPDLSEPPHRRPLPPSRTPGPTRWSLPGRYLFAVSHRENEVPWKVKSAHVPSIDTSAKSPAKLSHGE